jgi:hypothetical protein
MENIEKLTTFTVSRQWSRKGDDVESVYQCTPEVENKKKVILHCNYDEAESVLPLARTREEEGTVVRNLATEILAFSVTLPDVPLAPESWANYIRSSGKDLADERLAEL